MLSAPGPRGVVDEKAAMDIVKGWKAELQLKQDEFCTVLGKNDPSSQSQMPPLCERLVLSNKSYTSAAAKHIADFITSASLSSQVTSIDLSDIIASREESEGLSVLRTFSDAFQSSTKLVDIDLSDNAMGSKGISSSVSILTLRSLEKLSLCNNGLSESSMNEVADILLQSETCKRLKKIHFYNNMSGDGGCEAFVRILNHCGSNLVDIRFSRTRAQRQGSLKVAEAIRDLITERECNIEHLDLADNSFSTAGADVLSSSLHLCTRLKYLDVRDCLLEDDGNEQICRAISGFCPLDYFDMSGNDITRDDAQDIMLLLQKTPSLKTFRVQENELSSIGIK